MKCKYGLNDEGKCPACCGDAFLSKYCFHCSIRKLLSINNSLLSDIKQKESVKERDGAVR